LDAAEGAALWRSGKARQRRQGATALSHRVRSAFIHKVMGLVCEILSIHQVLPAEVSGQLSGQLQFLGLWPRPLVVYRLIRHALARYTPL
jgi:hypothetical protein